MMRVLLLMVCWLAGGVGLFAAEPADPPISYAALGELTIQDAGRLKPLDTYARTQLLAVYQKQKVDGLRAIDWFGELLLQPDLAYERKVFKVRNPAVIDALEIPRDADGRYSFVQLREAMSAQEERLHSLLQKQSQDEDSLSLIESQLVDLYLRALNYLSLSRSLTCFFVDLRCSDPTVAQQLGMNVSEAVNYLHMMRHRDALRDAITSLLERAKDADYQLDASDRALEGLVHVLNDRQRDQSAELLRILPPRGADEEWEAPWSSVGAGEADARQLELLQAINALVRAAQAEDAPALAEAVQAYNGLADHGVDVGLELRYNRADLFYRSLYFYILAFILLLLSFLFARKWLYRIAWASALFGLFLHGGGLVMRMVIMERPPVTTLYESVIFVGLIVMVTALVAEFFWRWGIALLCGVALASALHFIGFSYAADGDTMGMLVAVLDSNFWLATHVVTITMGYGVALVAAAIGHVQLGFHCFARDDKASIATVQNVGRAVTLVAILFTTLGTILGGIWADQSWGRFWGWDPKENGAMFIVLWLLAVVHGRLSGLLGSIGISVGLALSSIPVILAWFGVNLLSVGLHNYGFTEGVAFRIYVFMVVQLLVAVVGGIVATYLAGRPVQRSVDGAPLTS